MAWRVAYTDAAGQRGQRQFSTKKEAVEFRVEVEGRVRAGTFRPDATKVTVQNVCEAYLAHVEGRMKRGERFTRRHFEAVSGLIANHILHSEHGIGSLKLAQVTARGLADFRDRLRASGLSIPTTRKVVGWAKAVLDFAISRDLLATNAASGVSSRRDEGSNKSCHHPRNASHV